MHRLLADQIDEMGLSGLYEVQQAIIKGPHGTEFLFKGLRFNVGEIKSTVGVTDCWVEEAQAVSKGSWDVLIPTIREEGSQLYISFNPELEEDYTYQRFVLDPPANAVVRKINWRDNPFFPEVLRLEKEDLETRDPDAALTVWEGHPRQTLDGAVYAKEMREATAEDRIVKVPPAPGKAISTFWDIGRADATSIWFAQVVGFEFRIVDFYEANSHAIDHYLKVLQDRGYLYETHWLPHDAQAKHITHPLSIEGQVKAQYPKAVRIVPRMSIANGINAARSIFPNAVFDRDKCSDGLQHLRRYRFKESKAGGFEREPEHDEHSHAADAFRYLAIALKEPGPKKKLKLPPPRAGGWMAR